MRPYIAAAASNSAHEIAIEAVGPEAVRPCFPQAEGEGTLMTMCVLFVYAAASIGAVLGFLLCALFHVGGR